MADKKVKSIIPDVPLYGNPHTQAKTGVPDAGQPAKKGPAKPFSSGRKSAVKKPFADPETGKITDIDSLIEPPSKSEGLNAARIEEAVKTTNIPMILMVFVLIVFGLVILYSVSGPDA